MCIIAYKPKKMALFSDDTIRVMYERNPHGAGLMFRKPDGKVHIEKGFFSVDKLLSYVHENKELLDSTEVVMHFRIATSGKRDALGCHPYSVWSKNSSTSCDVELAMAHNGMLDNCGWRGNEEINDTQVFIKECIRLLPHNFLKNNAIKTLIEKAIDYNKLVFMGKDKTYTFGKFIYDNGYWFSNNTYMPIVYKPKLTPTTVDKSDSKLFNSDLFGAKPVLEKSEIDEMKDNLFRGGSSRFFNYTYEYLDAKQFIIDNSRIDTVDAEDELVYDDHYDYFFDDENWAIERFPLESFA